jgi:hypothetical protein
MKGLQAKIVRGLNMGLLLNLVLLGFVLWMRQSVPISQIRITTLEDSVLLFGKNRLGLLTVRSFDGWAETRAFLEKQGLRLQPISMAERGLSSEVELLPCDQRNPLRSHRIIWNSGSWKETLRAPDPESARIMAMYVRYRALVPTNFGYSLEVN